MPRTSQENRPQGTTVISTRLKNNDGKRASFSSSANRSIQHDWKQANELLMAQHADTMLASLFHLIFCLLPHTLLATRSLLQTVPAIQVNANNSRELLDALRSKEYAQAGQDVDVIIRSHGIMNTSGLALTPLGSAKFERGTVTLHGHGQVVDLAWRRGVTVR
jgi:hypothetical protein